MTSTPRATRALAALATAVLLAVGAAACNGDGSSPGGVSQGEQTAAPTPVLLVGDGRPTVRWEAPLTVRVRDGALRSVEVRDAAGKALEGVVQDGVWTATGLVRPATSYRVKAAVRGRDGSDRTLQASVRTSAARNTLRATLSPGDGKVVGIGQPVIVTLNRDVKDPGDRLLVQQRLSVTTVPPVAGAWRWMSPRELHYRGPTYWAKGTKISVKADFHDLALNDWVWGDGVRTSSYSIGSAVIATVDVQKLTMAVTVDGKLVRTVRVSTGRDKYPTKGGVHLVLEKVKVEVMDSATVGIPRNSPDGYYEKVPNSIRISYGGAFVHSASWSVRDQGVRNVSHGCVNISPADAAWFFGLVKRGDIVDIVHAKAPPLLSDPGMSDWNIPFAKWAS